MRYRCQSKPTLHGAARTSPAAFCLLWDITDDHQESRRDNHAFSSISTLREDICAIAHKPEQPELWFLPSANLAVRNRGVWQ